MQGVLTAIVAFLFVGIIFPSILKHKSQYYAAFGLTVVCIFLDVLIEILGAGGFRAMLLIIEALLLTTSMVLLLLSAGGLSTHDLAGNLSGAFEVMRRGGTEKELIIPISGQKAPGGKPVVYRDPPGSHEPPGRVYTINDPAFKPPTPADDASTPIPLE